MATNSQINSESPANSVQIGQAIETPPKRLKRKYDGRVKNPTNRPDNLAVYRATHKPGPKTNALYNLAKREANRFNRELDLIASWTQIYQAAWDRGLLELCFKVREVVDNRRFGKPYQAVNPDEGAKPTTVNNDNRLQVAIGQLIPGARAPKQLSDTVQVIPSVDASAL